jgi:hypothetical protein
LHPVFHRELALGALWLLSLGILLLPWSIFAAMSRVIAAAALVFTVVSGGVGVTARLIVVGVSRGLSAIPRRRGLEAVVPALCRVVPLMSRLSLLRGLEAAVAALSRVVPLMSRLSLLRGLEVEPAALPLLLGVTVLLLLR